MFPLNTAGRIGLDVALLLAGVRTLYFGRPVIVPLLIALLLASMLGPAAMWLHTKLKFPWGIACMSVVVGLVLANMLVVIVFSASAVRLPHPTPHPQESKKQYNQLFDQHQQKNT